MLFLMKMNLFAFLGIKNNDLQFNLMISFFFIYLYYLYLFNIIIALLNAFFFFKKILNKFKIP